ncbi:hypothetical protein E2C01_033142 [Portunus trituberculatus]|uniref:Uncharacterized protein n=1 Tax=Portunus trituberculatus TaxID=210409 RepID=A0A5B7EXU5_PORTR|nr:hypothetical protein [Portunus trituberculatus]
MTANKEENKIEGKQKTKVYSRILYTREYSNKGGTTNHHLNFLVCLNLCVSAGMCGAVQELRDYCVHVITRSINEHTQLNGLTQRDLQEVCAGLSVDLPLPIALSLPLDNLYWRRRTQAHFPPPHVSLQSQLNKRKGRRGGSERAHTPAGKGGGSGSTKLSSVSIPRSGSGGSVATTSTHAPSYLLPPTTVVGRRNAGGRRWRQVYVERYLSCVICAIQDTKSGWRQLSALLQELTSVSITINTSRGNGEVVEVEPGSLSHLDLFEIISALPNLQVRFLLSPPYITFLHANNMPFPLLILMMKISLLSDLIHCLSMLSSILFSPILSHHLFLFSFNYFFTITSLAP